MLTIHIECQQRDLIMLKSHDAHFLHLVTPIILRESASKLCQTFLVSIYQIEVVKIELS